MSDYSFLQSIEGGWKQLKKWTLQKVSSAPVDSVEGGVWYNETSKRIEVDIGSENKEVAYVGESAEHNSLLDKDGGDTINNYYGHVKQIHNNILDNFGKASGAIVSDSNNFIPIEQIPVGLLGGLTPKGAWNPSTNTPSLSNPPLATTRGWFYIASTSGTALGTDWASGDWCISDGTVWQKIDNTDKVSSVFGRTGSVVAASGDYNLDQINDGTTYKRITSTEKAQYAAAYDHSQSAHAPANADNTQAAIAAAAAKTTPVDADVVPILDSAASNAIKKLTWANVKATLKAYLDGVYEPKLTAGDTAKYFRGDKTWQDLAGAVRSTVLTGLSTATATAISATDSVLGAFGKLQSQINGKLSTDAGSIHAEYVYRSTAPSLAVGDGQYGLSAEKGYLNLFAQAGVAKLYSKSGAANATFVGDLATQQWTNTQLGGKVDKFSSGVKYYGADGTIRWRGIALIDYAFNYNGGGVHVRVIDRHGVYDVYIRGEGGETTAAVDRFYVMHSSLTPPIFKARVDGQKVYLYKQDSNGWVDVSILGSETKGNVTVALFDYSSTTNPGGFEQFGACSYESLKFCNNVTSDIQAQLNGKAATTHTHDSITSNAGDANTPVYFSGGKPVVCTSLDLSTTGNAGTATALTTSAGDANTPVYFSGGKPVACTGLDLFTTGGADWASRLYVGGYETGRNIDTLKAPENSFTAFVTAAPVSTTGLPPLTTPNPWAYITEQVHNDLKYAVQTVTDYWTDKTWRRRKQNGDWMPWVEVLLGERETVRWSASIEGVATPAWVHDCGGAVVVRAGNVITANKWYRFFYRRMTSSSDSATVNMDNCANGQLLTFTGTYIGKLYISFTSSKTLYYTGNGFDAPGITSTSFLLATATSIQLVVDGNNIYVVSY